MERFKNSDNKKLEASNENEKEYFEHDKEKAERIEKLKKMKYEGTLDGSDYAEYLKEVEFINESRTDTEIRERMQEAVRPFVEEKIEKGELSLASFGNHDHLGFTDDQFWGHYVFPIKGGLAITMYQREQIKGDPMDIEGERGKEKTIFLELDEEHRKKLVDKLKKDILNWEHRQKEEDYSYHEWDGRAIEGLEEAVELLS